MAVHANKDAQGTTVAVAAPGAPPATPAVGPAATYFPVLGPFQKGRAAQRAALARGMGEKAFRALLARVGSTGGLGRYDKRQTCLVGTC